MTAPSDPHSDDSNPAQAGETAAPDSPRATPRDTADPAASRADTSGHRGSRTAIKLSIVFVVVMVALIVAIWPRGHNDPYQGDDDPNPTAGPAGAPVSVPPGALADARRRAALQPCAAGPSTASQSPLAALRVPCLGGGGDLTMAQVLGGQPVVLNFWGYWCAPCRTELPALSEYAQQAAGKVRVVLIHARQGAENPVSALSFLIDSGVHLPTVVDDNSQVAADVGAGQYFPTTVLLRADGTIAAVHPGPFASAADIAAKVHETLGVA